MGYVWGESSSSGRGMKEPPHPVSVEEVLACSLSGVNAFNTAPPHLPLPVRAQDPADRQKDGNKLKKWSQKLPPYPVSPAPAGLCTKAN